MAKTIIVHVDGNRAVVLDKKGRYVKIKNRMDLRVGYETDIPAWSRLSANYPVKPLSVAATLLFVIALGYGAYGYMKPYSYIDMDINPSIEITANIFDRIIDVHGLNDDGKRLVLPGIDRNRKIGEGIEDLLGIAIKEGFLPDDDRNVVVFTVSSRSANRMEKIGEKVRNSAYEKLKSAKAVSEVLIEKVPVSVHNEALESGMSPGKFNLIGKLIRDNPGVKMEDLKDKPVREIVELIKDGTGKMNGANQGSVKEKLLEEEQIKEEEQVEEKEQAQGGKTNPSEENDVVNRMMESSGSSESSGNGTGTEVAKEKSNAPGMDKGNTEGKQAEDKPNNKSGSGSVGQKNENRNSVAEGKASDHDNAGSNRTGLSADDPQKSDPANAGKGNKTDITDDGKNPGKQGLRDNGGDSGENAQTNDGKETTGQNDTIRDDKGEKTKNAAKGGDADSKESTAGDDNADHSGSSVNHEGTGEEGGDKGNDGGGDKVSGENGNSGKDRAAGSGNTTGNENAGTPENPGDTGKGGSGNGSDNEGNKGSGENRSGGSKNGDSGGKW